MRYLKYACTQRLICRRYTGPTHAASVRQRNSRQTDFKEPPFARIARFCHAAFALSVTGKPRFKCSGMADLFRPIRADLAARQWLRSFSARFVGAAGWIVGGSFIELAIKC